MKIENKVKKAVQEKENVLETYKEALRDIGNYNQKYREDMVYEYDKFETLERKRKEFVIGKVKDYKECVDVSNFQSRSVNSQFFSKSNNILLHFSNLYLKVSIKCLKDRCGT